MEIFAVDCFLPLRFFYFNSTSYSTFNSIRICAKRNSICKLIRQLYTLTLNNNSWQFKCKRCAVLTVFFLPLSLWVFSVKIVTHFAISKQILFSLPGTQSQKFYSYLSFILQNFRRFTLLSMSIYGFDRTYLWRSTIKFAILCQTHDQNVILMKHFEGDKMGIVFRVMNVPESAQHTQVFEKEKKYCLLAHGTLQLRLCARSRVDEGDDKGDQTTCIGIDNI